MHGDAIATAADLPKLIGYRQLRELYGWPKRTVQEWIKARKFLKPLNLPGRENYWALDDIVAWMTGDLMRVAVSMPEDLDFEQIQHAELALCMRTIENAIGQPVDPEGFCNVNVATASRQDISDAMLLRFHLALGATFR